MDKTKAKAKASATPKPSEAVQEEVAAEPEAAGPSRVRDDPAPVAPRGVGRRRGRKAKKKDDWETSADPTPQCLCRQPSRGRMIRCESIWCRYAWFHFDCVNVKRKIPGSWFCPDCRGDSYRVPKPGF